MADIHFKNLLAKNGADFQSVDAYAWLLSDKSLNIIAAMFSQVTGLRFLKTDGFDECEAYVATFSDHDITLLEPKEGKNGRIDVMIEPAQTCEFTGKTTNFSSQLLAWLDANASVIGKFVPMK